MNPAMALKALRSLMAKAKPETLEALIIPSSDAHNSEYLAERDKRREFISGFTGSAGTAVVTQEQACLWTDGRYYAQAERELCSTYWTLQREGLPETPTKDEWLIKNLKSGSRVGADPALITFQAWNSIRTKLEAHNISLVAMTETNLVDKVWGDLQPAYPHNPVLPLALEFTGMTWQDKVARVRKDMKARNVGTLILSALDDVAYLFNLRGSDIHYNPVFFAYAAVTATKVYLFIAVDAVVDDIVRAHLPGVEFRPYESIESFIAEVLKSTNDSNKVWMSNTASQALVGPPNVNVITEVTPVTLMKMVKNETELEGFVNCHIRDAAALCCYFAWLEKEVPKGTIDEVVGAERLEAFRREMNNFVGLSFDTTSSAGPNGAIIHYRPSKDSCRTLTVDELYLVDSGAQYKDGTTDVTRTVHFGTPTEHEKNCFTRVLKGQIRIGRTIFPERIKGHVLDVLARTSLWEIGLDYVHGTGHGVGSYLNVHEGPIGISYWPRAEDPGLRPGMILSLEPGYYEDGHFGIRLENLAKIVVADTKHKFQNRDYLTFETLTMVPIQIKMIEPSLLDAEEIQYLNEFHEKCRETVGPLLRELGKTDALNWLIRETEQIG